MVNDTVFYEYVLMRLQEVMDDGTLIIGNREQIDSCLLYTSNIAKAAAISGDGPAVLGTEAAHGAQIFQRSILPKSIHDGLKFILELRGVELILVVGPPGMPELLPVVAEIHTDMAYCPKRLVLLLIRFRIEKARFLKGSGPQQDSVFTCSRCEMCIRDRVKAINDAASGSLLGIPCRRTLAQAVPDSRIVT